MDNAQRDELKELAIFVKGHVQRLKQASLDEVDRLSRGVLALLEENERLSRECDENARTRDEVLESFKKLRCDAATQRDATELAREELAKEMRESERLRRAMLDAVSAWASGGDVAAIFAALRATAEQR